VSDLPEILLPDPIALFLKNELNVLNSSATLLSNWISIKSYMKITIYCASSQLINQNYFEAASRLAKDFYAHNIEIIFGGGSTGLMGKIADEYLELGGEILGIMPQFMKDIEWAHKGVKRFIFTETMNQRKEKLIEGTDAIVALPGGNGTMEELFEVITLKRLGLFTKSIVILNTDGYYDHLKAFLDHGVKEKFMLEKHLAMWSFVDQPEEVLPTIRSTEEWKEDAINYAVPGRKSE